MSWLGDFFSPSQDTSTQTGGTQTSSNNSTNTNQNNAWGQLQPYMGQYLGTAFNPGATNQYQSGAAQRQGNAGQMIAPGTMAAGNIAANGIDRTGYQGFLTPYLNDVLARNQDVQHVASQEANSNFGGGLAARGALGNNTGGRAALNARLATDFAKQNSDTVQNAYNQAQGLNAQSTGMQLQGSNTLGSLLGQYTGANQAGFNMGQTLWQNPLSWMTQGASGLSPFLAGAGTTGSQSGNATGTTSGWSNGTTTQDPSGFQILSGLGGLASSLFGSGPGGTSAASGIAAMLSSDERVKDNIAPIGETFDGQPIYRYNYKGSPQTQIGLMAQDVEKHNPDAVGEINGIKAVNYSDATDNAARKGGFATGGSVGNGAMMPFHGGHDLPTKVAHAFHSLHAMKRSMGGRAGYEGGGGAWNTTVSMNDPSSTMGDDIVSQAKSNQFGTDMGKISNAFGKSADNGDHSKEMSAATQASQSALDRSIASLSQFMAQSQQQMMRPPGMAKGGDPLAEQDAESQDGGFYGMTPFEETVAKPLAGYGTPYSHPAKSHDPLTVRYNNPGALEYKPWMEKYGAKVGENGRYAQFDTPDDGYKVMDRVLDTYRDKHGLNTVSGIINRWAPPSVDNNSTDEYIKSVAGKVGVDPNAELGPDHRSSLRTAMASYEAGAPVGGSSSTALPPSPDGRMALGASDVRQPKERSFLDGLGDGVSGIFKGIKDGYKASPWSGEGRDFSPFERMAFAASGPLIMGPAAAEIGKMTQERLAQKSADRVYEQMIMQATGQVPGGRGKTLDAQKFEEERRIHNLPKWEQIGIDRYGQPVRGWVNPNLAPNAAGVATPATPGTGANGASVVPGLATNSPNDPALELTGEDFMKTLPAVDQTAVRAIVEGREGYPTGVAASKPRNQMLLQWVHQYDPTANAATYQARQKTLNSFRFGPMAEQAKSLNTAASHLGDLYKATERLNNNSFLPILNGPINTVARELGNKRLQDAMGTFEAKKIAVAGELAKVFRASGMSMAEIEDWKSRFSPSLSPVELKSGIRAAVDLIDGRLQALRHTWREGMGDKIPFTSITPEAQSTFDRLRDGTFGNDENKNDNHQPPKEGGSTPSAQPAKLPDDVVSKLRAIWDENKNKSADDRTRVIEAMRSNGMTREQISDIMRGKSAAGAH